MKLVVGAVVGITKWVHVQRSLGKERFQLLVLQTNIKKGKTVSLIP